MRTLFEYVKQSILNFKGAIVYISQFFSYVELSKLSRCGQSSCLSKVGNVHSPRKITWHIIKTKALGVLFVMLMIDLVKTMSYSRKDRDNPMTLGKKLQQFSSKL